MKQPLETIEKLVSYALRGGLLNREDVPFSRNLLLGKLNLTPPKMENPYELPAEEAETATEYLNILCAYAAEAGLIEINAEAFTTELMGLLTARPSEIDAAFRAIEEEDGAEAATDWFYKLCMRNNYIRVDDVKKNVLFEHDHPVGRLIITINLSKPEKDPKTIAMERLAPSADYPRCMLCVENPGYAGRINFPARQNHRAIPLNLCGEPWHFQYSPYSYYREHCIVFNDQHKPMKLDRGTFERMFDFISRFPHYFIGSNADLPIVGGSILSHDHFQGGLNTFPFPMNQAKMAVALEPLDGVQAEIIHWPLSTLRLRSTKRDAVVALSDVVFNAWRGYSDDSMGILAHTDAPHNTVTPILRKIESEYIMDLVLRNNRVSEQFPDGIYHPHADLHHIKKENIGLIEVMGLFILPGRLFEELKGVEAALSLGESSFNAPEWQSGGVLHKHLAWAQKILDRRGISQNAAATLREELTEVCARVLMDCGVYSDTDEGHEGFLQFLKTVGFNRKG